MEVSLCKSTLGRSQEIPDHHDEIVLDYVSQNLRFTYTQMRINGCITGSSGQVLVFSIWDVKVRPRITVLFGEPKINHVHLISPLAVPHQEIIRLNITMQKVFRV